MQKQKFHLSSVYIFLIALGLIAILFIWVNDSSIGHLLPAIILSGNSSYPAQGISTNSNDGYPSVMESTQSILSYENNKGTGAAEATRITIDTVFPELTAAAEATKLAPVIPNMNGGCYTDDNKEYFSLQLPSGWWGSGDHANYTILNYKNEQLTAGKVDPVNTLWIQIETPSPDNTMSLDDLLNSWTILYKVEPLPYKIGRYNGYIFNLNNNTNEGAKEIIILSIKNGKYLIFGLGPGDSQLINEGLSILATLDDSASCSKQPGTSNILNIIPAVYILDFRVRAKKLAP